MRRRAFMAGLVAATILPLAARAQQPAMPVIGFLNAASPEEFKQYVAGFRRGLREGGYEEGRNVAIEYRWAENRYERLPDLAADLVGRRVQVIVASTPAARPAKAATSTIPIVFFAGYDPVEFGLVSSLSRPGGNLTGVTGFAITLLSKRVGLLHELVPGARSIAFLLNPANPYAERYVKDAQDAMRGLGLQMHLLNAKTEAEIERAFVTLAAVRAEALVVAPDAFFIARRDLIHAQVERVRVPAIYPFREFAAGGLMVYGPNLVDEYRDVGRYTARILKGEKPGDLPVLQPTTFELIINLKIAKALKVEIPPTLLARADEVIE
jgi:putative tryptophan/tyrosine transport system substrate-binding protein